jgi:hypothetical protein
VPKTVEQALRECESLVGRQFTQPAVAALLKLYQSGELVPEGPAQELVA